VWWNADIARRWVLSWDTRLLDVVRNDTWVMRVVIEALDSLVHCRSLSQFEFQGALTHHVILCISGASLNVRLRLVLKSLRVTDTTLNFVMPPAPNFQTAKKSQNVSAPRVARALKAGILGKGKRTTRMAIQKRNSFTVIWMGPAAPASDVSTPCIFSVL
jgi:hypothetical protein